MFGQPYSYIFAILFCILFAQQYLQQTAHCSETTTTTEDTEFASDEELQEIRETLKKREADLEEYIDKFTTVAEDENCDRKEGQLYFDMIRGAEMNVRTLKLQIERRKIRLREEKLNPTTEDEDDW